MCVCMCMCVHNNMNVCVCVCVFIHNTHMVSYQVQRVLKPGGLVVDSAWVMTDLYDPDNPDHVKIKADIEVHTLYMYMYMCMHIIV